MSIESYSPMYRSAKKRLEEEARTTRTNRMLIAMVVIFGVSWFPINLINLLADTMDLGKEGGQGGCTVLSLSFLFSYAVLLYYSPVLLHPFVTSPSSLCSLESLLTVPYYLYY